MQEHGEPLSPLDGRYRERVVALSHWLSEGALNRARVRVELEWLLFLTDRGVFGVGPLAGADRERVVALAQVSASDLEELAEIEAQTRHDVKAVEYFLRRRLEELALPLDSQRLLELVHFGCTSEDINNLAYALCVRSALGQVWRPELAGLLGDLEAMAGKLASLPLLSRTHGQAATPSTLGKELAVFCWRLRRQLRRLDGCEFLGKFSGATGTFSAHLVAAPGLPWQEWAREFVEGLGLAYNPLTTQIESHDWQAELFGVLAQVGRVLHNLATDMWSYISLGYFRQRQPEGAVGSSTMPHKVNPIDFENAEANLEVAGALFGVLVDTLSTSRLQRDLTDSTMQRNIGVAFGHSLLAAKNLRRGLATVSADEQVLRRDLEATWEVLTEAVQTVLRAEVAAGRSRIVDPYELLKGLSRGQRLSAERLREFILGLDISEEARQRLLALTPGGYTGLAASLARGLGEGAESAPHCDQKRAKADG